ncbi:MAG TPA: lytic transglycosylase domain-containing protein [Marmoricola sp.]|nr:lytic transglycosylase domain-containing protein [Marmoricola sp.]
MAAKAPTVPGKALSRRSKALTIIPVALLSGVWTASLVTTSATAAGTQHGHGGSLPDGTKVPTQAIQAPASVPIPGEIAPGVPNGTEDSVINGASTNGIPTPALAAYQKAAQIIDTADKSCNIPWELIAAIGRVESDHGQYDGNHLTAKGIATPGIYGPVLDGSNNTQPIPDTDGGVLDHNTRWDRAVGPMQFIPSTWSVVKVDADGDGQRNPQDINDASLATAVYLCSGNENLSTRSGQEQAVYRYNHSQSYVDLVLRLMEAYSQGDYTAVPAGSSAGTLFTPDYASAVTRAHQHHVRQQRAARAHQSHVAGSSSTTTSGPTGSTGSTGSSGGTDSGSGGGSGGGTGSTGGSVTDTVKNTVNGVTSGSGGSTGGTTQPVVDTLTYAEAQTVCSDQLARLGTALTPITSTMVNDCASKVQGETKDQAIADIPDTLPGVLAWLGLG